MMTDSVNPPLSHRQLSEPGQANNNGLSKGPIGAAKVAKPINRSTSSRGPFKLMHVPACECCVMYEHSRTQNQLVGNLPSTMFSSIEIRH